MVTPRLVLLRRLAALLGVLLIAVGDAGAQQAIPQMPEAWKRRVLRNPPGYETLAPSDVFIGFRRHAPTGNIWLSTARMAPGNTPREADGAYESQIGMLNTIHRDLFFRGSDMLGKITVGWVAFVRVANPMPIQAPNFPIEAAGLAYGAASLPEALEMAAKQAIESFRRAGGRRFESLMVEAGVSAKPDYLLYRRNGTGSNRTALPCAFITYFPDMQGDAARWGYSTQFPQDAKDLVRWLLAPEQKARAYTAGGSARWYGTWPDGFNLPRPGMALPVFLSGIQDAAYRSDASLSPEERQQRDETATLGLELYGRSRQTPAALTSALQLLQEAAKLGHAEAQRTLGVHYHGRGRGPEERASGLAWLGAAATQGSVMAKGNLIDALLGNDMLDPDRAIAEMEGLAESGQLDQYLKLAWVFRNGKQGQQPNPAKAVEYLKRGIGYVGKESDGYRNWMMDYLAIAYFRGEGTAQDRAAAAQLLRESNMEGSSQSTPGDIYRAHFYATGEFGFPRDPVKAQTLMSHVYPGEWSEHDDQRQATQAAIASALVADQGEVQKHTAAQDVANPPDTAPETVEPSNLTLFGLWSGHAVARAALDSDNSRPEVITIAPSGTSDTPSGKATVRVSALLDEAGRVLAARTWETSDPNFNQAAVAHVQQLDFGPAGAGAKPGASLLLVTVRFAQRN